ncbi:MAG: hypothetical protein ACR2O0_02985 [Rhizobiaceae bacterium]
MKIFVALALLFSGAAYTGYVPELEIAGYLPLSLFAGGTITAGMLYFLAKMEH